MRRTVLGVIKSYRRFVSPLLPSSCRFTPSCSKYTLLAIEKHGLLVGGCLGAWRLLRCNPFSEGGHDPIN